MDAGLRAEADSITAHWAQRAQALSSLAATGEALIETVRAGVPSTRSASEDALARTDALAAALARQAADTAARWQGEQAAAAASAARELAARTHALTAACGDGRYEDADLAYLAWPQAVSDWRRAVLALYTAVLDAPMQVWGLPPRVESSAR